MTPEEYNKYMSAAKEALQRASKTKWDPDKFGLSNPNDLMPVKQRASRPAGWAPTTFEQRLTDEDRAFLADLKVGL